MFECTNMLLVCVCVCVCVCIYIYIYPVNNESLNLKNKNMLNNKSERFLTSVGTLATDVMTDYSRIPFSSHT